MKREFQIFKQGVTDGKITILSKNGEYFNKSAKVAKYKYLGYTVYEMSGDLL